MRSKQLISDAEFLKARDRLNQEISSLAVSIGNSEIPSSIKRENVGEILVFLSNLPGRLNRMPMDIRRRFQQNLFPDGLEVGGIGTAQKPPIFRFIDEFQNEKQKNVHHGSKVWNRF